jgi:tetratricopeptide (TPR) repeat protein
LADTDKRRQKLPYLLAFGLFVLALTSKTVTATLPPALLVLFWWQRGRLEWRRDVVPLAPFFSFGIAMGLFNAWFEREGIGAVGDDFQFTLAQRVLISGRVGWFYAWKLAWPINLIFMYPRWEVSAAVWWQWLFPAATLGLLAGLWLLRKRTRAPLAAILFFGGTLFPVLGFLNVYPFVFSFVADHFQYLASLGLITLVAAGAALLAARLGPGPKAKSALIVLTLAMACVLGALCWRQSRQYADLETLYRETLERNPTAWLCHYNLGDIVYNRNDFEEALIHYQNTLRYRPTFLYPHFELGNTLYEMGRYEEAIEHYEIVIRHIPDHVHAYFHRGFAFEKLGRLDEAALSYRLALRLAPGAAELEYNLGNVLAKQGRLLEAMPHLELAARIRPGFAPGIERLREVRAQLDSKK